MRKILFVILAMLCLTLCACNEGGTKPTKYTQLESMVDFTIYGDFPDLYLRFYYAVDNATDVVYILGSGYRSGYMTVALNADGTPVTKDQIIGWGEKGNEMD